MEFTLRMRHDVGGSCDSTIRRCNFVSAQLIFQQLLRKSRYASHYQSSFSGNAFTKVIVVSYTLPTCNRFLTSISRTYSMIDNSLRATRTDDKYGLLICPIFTPSRYTNQISDGASNEMDTS